MSANLGDVFFEVRSITSEFCGVNLRIVLSTGSFDFFGEGLTLVFKFFLEVDTTKPVVANRVFGELFPLMDSTVSVNAKGFFSVSIAFQNTKLGHAVAVI